MAEDGPLNDLTDSLDDKVGGIPVWVIGLGLGLLVAVVWFFYNRNTDGATVRVFDPESAEAAGGEDTEPSNSDFGLPDGPIGDWLSQNPGSSAYPVSPNSLPITNAQWARYVTDTFLSKGDDPSLVTNAISKYLQGLSLSVAEVAVINRALALMSPPEGVLPIKDSPAFAAPTGLKIVRLDRTAVRISWNAVPEATGYRIYANGTWKMESVSPVATVAFLKANTSYKIEVAPVKGLTVGPRGSLTVKTKK